MEKFGLTERFAAGRGVKELLRALKTCDTVGLAPLAGSSWAFAVAAVAGRRGGVHVVVAEDRERAAYLCNDLYNVTGEESVYFFPTSYKRSIQFGQEDPSGEVQRGAALKALREFSGGRLILCTYPEAIVERVVGASSMERSVIRVAVGDTIPVGVLESRLIETGFTRTDFVYEPGQYSIRGGIVDVFSYAGNRPLRLDFFGDEVESIRLFDIASQLSNQRLERTEIVPGFAGCEERISLAGFIGPAVWWFADPEYTFKRMNEIRTRLLGELDEPSRIDLLVTGRKGLLHDLEGSKAILGRDNLGERAAERSVEFRTAPQPAFNKQFDLLAEDIRRNREAGYECYILSENKAQIERLENIFASIGVRQAGFTPLPLTLHEGFIDHDLKVCLYTDHQIFDRYHRYRLRGEIDKSESMTIAELNALKVGDYVVHIDHGVGRFGGVVKSMENGRMQESIKLVYKDGDVLLVNVHSLHRISRYKDGESEPPRIYKLGSGAWQRMKAAAKKAVKDMARELIALYAKRKASGGYAFSPDSYLQHELEASFIYEDTPDQQKAVEMVKHDMESPRPMDRLVCGDVGFGKTEVAVRAAFKAACDSKQTAVLVPTTILALQHYRTFSERLRGLPVRVEYLNRTKSGKEVKQILAELKAGRIDIIIGTHKLLGKEVVFHDLGLLVIDEEQKFGVASKEKLRQLSVQVDTLTLTATPIPRTLQFSLMGSRDLSVISTPPANRQPVTTESHTFSEELIAEAVEYELARGGQVYFVHNRVESIEQMAALIRRLCPKARVMVGHGQMNPQELEKLVMDFIYGEYDVLVATTIIENGIDVPNANTIIINDAHRFGLSDLHQMRGRVGRSNKKAFCYLLSPPEELLQGDARRRLRAIEEFSDLGSGFNIAMQDLDIRGAGNLLGAQQSGFIADIGCETYQRILNEAVTELRAEGLSTEGVAEGEEPAEEQEVRYLDDSHIETDQPAYIPDSYVSRSTEKIKLYKELDSITDAATLERFRADMVDRFGALPDEVAGLMDVVRLRWMCIRLGFERAKVKNGLMILQFVGAQDSPYFKTRLFMNILKYVTSRPEKFVLRQNNNRLALTVRQIKNVEQGRRLLSEFEKL